ncbi:SDR family NAD(P)-dependent oxidoreductase [Sphingomonas jatrophae]|uniref:NAD(P)-dependent dehydrogenase, short-chain alcohol dehydrogenase family n=1 Tax=Sphingomonas jatrophae TaxID=1166337 RepID=A0A1I6M033_9SPHN|nr:SDR family oxidoreductase [Sphingomonas jatrophae]SFS09069.1 NAD(P)-dependent dehydrogenase, short-chain alcohol dehydrogenase family [Sphingomonas jatrophae]
MTDIFPEGAALIFGGSGGIGQGVTMEFAKAGTDVAICYRSKRDAAEKTAEAVRAEGVNASIHQVDVRDPAQVKAAVAAAVAGHDRIHSMIWGAGPLVPQIHISDWTPDHYRNAIEVEVLGFFNAVQALLPHFRTSGGGSFVHLGSAGHDWWPAMDGLSVAPKAANEALIKGIAKEEGKYEIRANSVLVGVIDAGMFHELSRQGVFDEAWVNETQKLLALKRWGEAADIGQAAVYFASSRARYVTGQTISVSGGFGV